MYIVNDICYAGELIDDIRIKKAISLGRGIMLVTFSTGETRLFDVTELKGSAFAPLKNDEILSKVELFHGIMTWNDGEIDIAPDTVYSMSYPYSDKEVMVM